MDPGGYMDMALQEAMRGYRHNEVPVGCVVVRDNEVIARAHNMTNRNKSPLEHAEFIAVRKADCRNATFYVTCEPCIMCMGILGRIEGAEVVYGCRNQIFGSDTVCSIAIRSTYLEDGRCSGILRKFYERENIFAPDEKRKSKKINLLH
jgi:tRNA-specific adenosine deaminase 2